MGTEGAAAAAATPEERISLLEGNFMNNTNRIQKVEETVDKMHKKLLSMLGEIRENIVSANERITAQESQMMLARQYVDSGLNRVSVLEAAFQAGGNRGATEGNNKPLLESKAIQNMKVLGNDRAEYRMWQEKFANAMEQLRPGSKALFRLIGNKVMAEGIPLGPEGKWDEEKANEWLDEVEATGEDFSSGNWRWRLKKDLELVLIDKFEGEARNMVKNSSPEGSGLEAWMRIHDWFSRISGEGMSERRHRVMIPRQAKKEEDIVVELERWKREVREVELADENDGGEGKLPFTYKLAALKRILVGKIADHVRFKESELLANIKDKGEAKHRRIYEEIEKEVYTYVRLTKLEKPRKEETVPMDTDAVDKSANESEGYQDAANWWAGKWDWSAWDNSEDVDALGRGKAKAKGKGKNGGWDNKDKGKGKGGAQQGEFQKPFFAKCTNCGVMGHSARNCPELGKGIQRKLQRMWQARSPQEAVPI